MKHTFYGTYYKHQKGEKTLCFVVGQGAEGTFVQAITNQGVFHSKTGVIATEHALTVDMPHIHGSVTYGAKSPLRSPIMGPFSHLPMECSHWVESMRHRVTGGFWVDNDYWDFTDGWGYIEGDKGRSFPQHYTWLQCNDFPNSAAIMLAIATIPFGFSHFTGCICAIQYQGQEYRLATYLGVRIRRLTEHHIVLEQGALHLEVVMDTALAHPLNAPNGGKMTGVIHESNQTPVYLQLWNGKDLVVDGYSHHGSFEWQI